MNISQIIVIRLNQMNKYNKYNYTLKIIMIFFKNCYFEFEYESQFSELPHISIVIGERLHHQTK